MKIISFQLWNLKSWLNRQIFHGYTYLANITSLKIIIGIQASFKPIRIVIPGTFNKKMIRVIAVPLISC